MNPARSTNHEQLSVAPSRPDNTEQVLRFRTEQRETKMTEMHLPRGRCACTGSRRYACVVAWKRRL